MKLANIEQCLCYDEKTGSIHQVTTGATMNYTHYLSTSIITENYRITDTTLRKKYKTNGVENRDYFYSDNKVLVSESFLKKINVKMKSSSINSKSTNGDLKIPYKRILNKEDNEVKNLLINSTSR
jgi:hypothetical protein